MASEKPARILLAKTDLSESEVEELSDGEAWELIYKVAPPKSRRRRDDRPAICFTGLRAAQKAELAVLAKELDLKIVGSVTVDLAYLCYGDNAGAKKLDKARAQGGEIMNMEQFVLFAKTGELPK